MAGRDDLGDVGAVAEAAGEGHLQDFLVGRIFEVVVGADDLGAVLAAEVLEALADRGRGFDLQVGQAGARLDGEGEPVLGFLLGSAFREPAGRNQGDVGAAEELPDLVVGEGAAVEADLRHLDPGIFEDLEELLEALIL